MKVSTPYRKSVGAAGKAGGAELPDFNGWSRSAVLRSPAMIMGVLPPRSEQFFGERPQRIVCDKGEDGANWVRGGNRMRGCCQGFPGSITHQREIRKTRTETCLL